MEENQAEVIEEISVENNEELVKSVSDLVEVIQTQIDTEQENLELQKQQEEIISTQQTEQTDLQNLNHEQVMEQLTMLTDFFSKYDEKIDLMLNLFYWYGVIGLPLIIIVTLLWVVYREFMYTNL
ncbi:MAG: hypothetical protein H9W81_17575 [Enterococcus sp.]|nr:hypothetical protein [Enterococcus sp.]